MKNILVEKINNVPIEEQKVEIVERKGIGHPDSLSDGIAEAVSRALCKEYLRKADAVFHHNTDETQIVAGRAIPEMGGGEVISPIYILLVGRATKSFNDISFATDTLALKTARDYIREHFNNLDVESQVAIDCRIGEGSSDLKDVFASKSVPKSNDTSFGVGHAPFSETEKITYEIERNLYNTLRNKEPSIGEDIKVMGLRDGEDIMITISNAIIGRYIDDMEGYKEVKEKIKDFAMGVARRHTERSLDIQVNTADNYDNGEIFLTVTGTSAENGDDGSVGRGNRCNGLITPCRPMSMEATSGKNPINHIGKIYNLLSTQMAREIAEKVDGVQEVYIKILSQIGQPIDDPKAVSTQVIPKTGNEVKSLEPDIKAVVEDWLDNIIKIREMVIAGKLDTF